MINKNGREDTIFSIINIHEVQIRKNNYTKIENRYRITEITGKNVFLQILLYCYLYR